MYVTAAVTGQFMLHLYSFSFNCPFLFVFRSSEDKKIPKTVLSTAFSSSLALAFHHYATLGIFSFLISVLMMVITTDTDQYSY